MQRVESRTDSGSQGELAAACVRTVKTAAGSTAVQVVHSTRYLGILHDALDRIPGTQVGTSWPDSGLTPVKAAAC